MEFLKKNLSPTTRWILLGIAAVLVALLIFDAGIAVGAHAGLRMRSGGEERGFRPFGAPGFVLPDGYMPRGHGAVGTIATVTLPTLTITEPEGDIETVLVSTTTVIDSPQGSTTNLLTPGVRVIIFGDPDESVERINAKVIHLLP